MALSVEETNTLFHFGGTLSSAAWVSLPQKRSWKNVTFTVNHLPWSKWHHTWARLVQLWERLYVTTRFFSMRLHNPNIVKYGATICFCRWRFMPIVIRVPCQGWLDVWRLYDILPRFTKNSEFLDLVDIFQHRLCLPHRKAGRDTPSTTWRQTLSPMKPEKWLGQKFQSAKHVLRPVKWSNPTK